jgi:hypothetical protein
MPAASAIMNAVVISRFPVAFVVRLVGMGTWVSIHARGHCLAIFPPAEIFC